MIKLYDLLKAEKTGLSTDLITAILSNKMQHVITEKELEGVPPLTFKANGDNLIAYSIDGNLSNLQATGEKTDNLAPDSTFENTTTDTKENVLLMFRLYNGSTIIGGTTLNITETGTFTLGSVVSSSPVTRLYIKHNGSSRDISILDINVEFESGHFWFTADFESIDPTVVGGIKLSKIMLNEGSSSKSYEPYGYKLPIVCGGETNNIYIGANPLRKSIDGTAVDTVSSNGTLTRRVDSDGSVLETPTTETVTAPTIPTVNGSNTFNVNTTVSPSKAYIKYKG